jgi:hypothetical protein
MDPNLHLKQPMDIEPEDIGFESNDELILQKLLQDEFRFFGDDSEPNQPRFRR